MHQLMLANPAMKELIEANPEITQMMHNKELMETIANLAHNPAMLQVNFDSKEEKNVIHTLLCL